MDKNLFIGLLISSIAIILPLLASIITPIVKLNKTIQKLNDAIDRLKNLDIEKTQMLKKVFDVLDKHQGFLQIDKKRIDNLSVRMSKIDHEAGFEDNEKRV